jgi:hypothetical protein
MAYGLHTQKLIEASERLREESHLLREQADIAVGILHVVNERMDEIRGQIKSTMHPIRQ